MSENLLKCSLTPENLHLLNVLGPVDVAHHTSGEVAKVRVVKLGESQQKSQDPDYADYHHGLSGCHPLF